MAAHMYDPDWTYQWYRSTNHVNLTLALVVVAAVASSSVGMPRRVMSRTLMASLVMVERTWSMSLNVTGRCRRHDTSSRVIVISLIGRWKDKVSWCHFSTRQFTKPLFVVTRPITFIATHKSSLSAQWGVVRPGHRGWPASSLVTTIGLIHDQQSGPYKIRSMTHQLDLFQMEVQWSYHMHVSLFVALALALAL